jgi:prepilin-type processing-associated H-X9-DG protein
MPSALSSLAWTTTKRSLGSLNPSSTGLLLDNWDYVPVTDWWLQPPHPQAGSISNASNRHPLRHSAGKTDNYLFVDGHTENLKKGDDVNSNYVMYYW